VTARCGSCRLPVQRLPAGPRWVSAVARARPDSRGVDRPFRVSWCHPSSAFVAPSAPASPVRDRASRSSSCNLTPSLRPRLLSWGFALLQSRSVVRLPVLRRARPFVFANDRRPAEPGISPLVGSCSLERLYAGCPLSPHHDLSTAAGWVEVARPPPVPSSGFLPLSTVLATHAARTDPCESAVTVAPRRFAALFHAARALESPFRAFPSRGAVPALAGLLLPCGFALDQPNGAARTEVFAAPFPGAPTSRRSSPEGSLDRKAGTTVPWSR